MKRFFTALGNGIVVAFRWCARALRSAAIRLRRFVAAIVSSRLVRGTVRTVLSTVRVATWTAAFAALAFFTGWLCFRRVPPSMIGVKQMNFGGEGIVARDYPCGLHFGLRGLTDWHFVDGRTHVISFAWESEGGDHPMLDVRTKDGTLAQVGVSVPYRVKRGEAHDLVKEGLKTAYRQRVKSTVEKVMLEELADLSAADLASTNARLACAQAALPKLNAQLAALHVEAERVLITQVMFGIEYEKKLQLKQLTAQEALLFVAKTERDKQQVQNTMFLESIDASEKTIAAEMNKRIAERYAEGRRTIAGIETEAREYDKRRRTEAQAEYDRLVAAGERALSKSEQLKEEMANEVYDSKGGRMMLARRAAENLNIRQVTLNSNDPRVPSVLDLDDLVKLLVGGSASVKN
jgi:regulator of protease activity HflC (stomatin/prohibitin superfamily)